MTAAKHLGIVLNPTKTSRDDVEQALASLDRDGSTPEISWFDTTVDDPGQGMADAAIEAGADVVVAAGGDGTVRAVAQRLADADASARLGIIPLGTGNLLARNLGVPLGDIAKAIEVMLDGRDHTVDLAWAEADLGGESERMAFTVMAGVGVDAHMITETDEDLKDKVGWLAYVESLGRALTASDVLTMQVCVDDGEATQEEAHTIIVGNCGILTGGVTLLPDADPSDGELDLLVLSADDVTSWMDTLRTMVWDNGLKRLVAGQDAAESSDTVEHRRLTSVTVDLAEPRMLELDGEDVGECSRVAFSVQPGALNVRVPRD